MSPELYIPLLIAIVAFFYASVGHGGASGYLALMAIFSISPAIMKPSALILNILVSAISFSMYYRSGYFKWKLLWPFILLSIPMSYWGAHILIDKEVYKIILAICLFIATLRLLGVFGKGLQGKTKEIILIPAILIGALLGFISGMIGIGGGILLSPVLLLLRWADMKQTAAISAAFIFVNSIAGIIGTPNLDQIISPNIALWAGCAAFGGIIGAFYGSHKFNFTVLRYLLSAVLLFAITKLVI